MRISDWSSDVCSSDLGWVDRASRVMKGVEDPLALYPNIKRWFQGVDARPAVTRARMVASAVEFKKVNDEERAEERRVGKACVSTCRSRWSPYHYNKKIKTM